MVATIPRSATPEEIQQGIRLIIQGKIGASQGDPRMQRIIAGLQAIPREDYRKALVESQERAIELQRREALLQTPGQQFLEKAGVPTGDVKSIIAAKGKTESIFVDGRSYIIASSQKEKFLQDQAILGKQTYIEGKQAQQLVQQQAEQRRVAIEPSPQAIARAKESFVERNIISRTPRVFPDRAGGVKEVQAFSLPGTIAKPFLRTGEFITEKIGVPKFEKKYGEKIPSWLKISESQALGIGGGMVLFAGFAPALTTTAQVETAIGTSSGVAFKGVQQKLSKDIVKTDVFFTTERLGKVTPRGFRFPDLKIVGGKQLTRDLRVGRFQARTQIKSLEGGVFESTTAGRGVIAKPLGFRFPDLKLGLGREKLFAVVSKSFGRRLGGQSFISVGKGGVQDISKVGVKFPSGRLAKPIGKGDLTKFVDVSVGLTKKRTTIVAGALKSETGQVTSVGLLKQVKPKPDTFILDTAGGSLSKTQLNKLLKNIALSQAQAGVQAGVLSVPKSSLGVVPSLAPLIYSVKTTKQPQIQTTKPQETQTLKLDLITKQIPKVDVKMKSVQLPRVRESFKTIQQPILVTKQKSVQKQKEALKLVQQPKLITKQRISLSQREGLRVIQKQKTLLKPAIFVSPFVIPKTPVPKPFPFKLGEPTKQGQQRGGFEVFGRRFGKFKLLGIGKTPRQAIGIGREFASKTLGATFKVPKSKAIKLPGFRTKKTKEGVLFIEKRKYRLSKAPEIKEIQFFKRKKKRKKK